jgi:hypothetical protein
MFTELYRLKKFAFLWKQLHNYIKLDEICAHSGGETQLYLRLGLRLLERTLDLGSGSTILPLLLQIRILCTSSAGMLVSRAKFLLNLLCSPVNTILITLCFPMETSEGSALVDLIT